MEARALATFKQSEPFEIRSKIVMPDPDPEVDVVVKLRGPKMATGVPSKWPSNTAVAITGAIRR
jgi:hypothetical protein